MRHGLLRPPMYGEPGGLQGEVTLAELLADAGYVTQAVGKWHMGENVESQPQNVGFDDFYGFLSVSDMYTEWRDPYFFPEIVYSEERTEWIENLPFNKCFVHAHEAAASVENVEEVTIPVLSLLDDKWCDYSPRLHPPAWPASDAALVPLPLHARRALRQLPARALPRHRRRRSTPTRTRSSSSTTSSAAWSQTLEATGQLEDTLVFISSDNGPRWRPGPTPPTRRSAAPRARPGKAACGCPAIVVWPGMIDAGPASDGLFDFTTASRRRSASPARPTGCPTDRYIDGVDQTLVPARRPTAYRTASTTTTGSSQHVLGAARAASTRWCCRRPPTTTPTCTTPGGFTGVQKLHLPRLYNLYLDPKEQHSYMIRKLAYLEAFQRGMRNHLATFKRFPAKKVMGIKVADKRTE